jgi:hypothetical protein
MNLLGLGLITRESFLRDVSASAGPILMRSAYPVAGLDTYIQEAKHLMLLLSLNKTAPFTVEELLNRDGRLYGYLSMSDFTQVAAYAIAYQNKGFKLQTAADAFAKYFVLKQPLMVVKNPADYNVIAFEYAWRCAAQWSNKNVADQNGPVYTAIRSVFAANMDPEKPQETKSDIFEVFKAVNATMGSDVLPPKLSANMITGDRILTDEIDKVLKSL